jgi:ABC-2 type transport system permease protein
MSLFQPFLWLVFMGNMYSRLAQVPGFPARRYLDYMAPGIIAMVSLFGGIFGGMGLAWDRRLGYLTKILASPISRTGVIFGRMLAIGLSASVQALLISLLALLFGVRPAAGALSLLLSTAVAFLLSQLFAALSLGLASVILTHENVMAVVNFLTMPVMLTSNALVPLEFMPPWLAALARLNPLTYALTPLRSLFLEGMDWRLQAESLALLALGTAALGLLATRLLSRPR